MTTRAPPRHEIPFLRRRSPAIEQSNMMAAHETDGRIPALLAAFVQGLGSLGWREWSALVATILVLSGNVALGAMVLVLERVSLVQAPAESRVGKLVSLVLVLGYSGLRGAPDLLPVGILLTLIGLFAQGAWRLVAIADMVLLVPLVWAVCRLVALLRLDAVDDH